MFLPVTLQLLAGFWESLKIFVLTLVFSLPLGLVICFGSMSKFKPLRWLTRTFVWIIRGTPLMLQLLIIFYGPGLIFDLPSMPRFTATIVAFVINYACYFSEIYRGGIESIPVGQYEAGQVLGMTRQQIFFKVVLLQVVKRIMAPMSNEVITLVKDTSLAFTIGLLEMFTQAKAIAASTRSMTPFFLAAVFYYIFNYAVAYGMEQVEKKLRYYQ